MKKNIKQSLWEENETKLKEIKPQIEKNVFDTVVALNCLNVTTSSSSEGDVERKIYGPYIDCSLPDSDPLIKEFVEKWSKAHELSRENRREEDMKKRNDEKANELMREAHSLRSKVLKKTAEEIGVPLLEFLNSYYDSKDSDIDTHLVLVENGFASFRIQSQGVCLQPARENTLRLKKLEIYRKELSDWGIFLKTEYEKGSK